MQSIQFSKYHGAGNDFILIDNRKNSVHLNAEQIKHLCDRHFGIGADGLMLLQTHPKYDFQMIYYNSDGKEGSMCGNGGRCIVQFAYDLKLIGNQTIFIASDGEHEGFINTDNRIVKIKMIDVSSVEIEGSDAFIDTGSPHHMQLEENVNQIDVYSKGSEIRNSEKYAPGGCNVNFVEKLSGAIRVRTFERGVENETLACGTGAVASAIFAFQSLGYNKIPISVQMPGGKLNVYFDTQNNGKYHNIWLEGPAEFVFLGEFSL